MKRLFENCVVDINNGTVKTRKGDKRTKNKNGYYPCRLMDCYGNKYHYVHEIIVAEGLQLPKHLWPVDENGKKFQVDHIIPVSQGGTDEFSNLRLVSEKVNHNNQITKTLNSEAKKGKHYSIETEFKIGRTPWNKGIKYHTNTKRKHSDETKERIRKLMKYNNNASKKVYQYNMNGELVKVWDSVLDAARKGYNSRKIYQCCYGKSEQSNGYRWTYNPL